MRLGQLARKLAVKPSEIVSFLNGQDISIEDGVNTRLEDDKVELIVKQFGAGLVLTNAVVSETIIQSPEEQDGVSTKETESAETLTVHGETFDSPIIDTATDVKVGETEGQASVIKAPKIELQGLKVLGKIELPQTKPKASEASEIQNEPVQPPQPPNREQRDTRRRPTYKTERPERRPSKNPIAEAREQEELEAKKKRDAEAEFSKEQRTKNYYKKVKVSSPTKKARLIDEPSEDVLTIETNSKPTSLFGKLVRWFKT